MPSVLITRPRAAAEAFAERLRQEGIETYIAPLMEYVAVPADLSAAMKADALVFSSVQAVTMFAEQSDMREIPVFAVGEATAAAASAAGFSQIYTSAGDSMSLAGLIRAREQALGLKKLFHPAGEDTAGDLHSMLSKDGISVTRATLYKAAFIDGVAPEIETALIEGRIDSVTLFSARTAENFVRLMKQDNMKGVSAKLEAVSLSPRITKELRGTKWRSIYTAKTPSMSAIVDHLTGREHVGATLQADPVIAAFGGIRPMATRLKLPPSTVQGWKNRYVIPDTQVDAVLAAAEVDGIQLDGFWREERKAQTAGAAPERRRGQDRRQTPATFDSRGYVISPNYVGPDRRSGIDRREMHSRVQQQRIHKEKVRFAWRTALSFAFVSCAILYVGIFLLMPEYSRLQNDAHEVEALQAKIDAMNKRIIELQKNQVPGAQLQTLPAAPVNDAPIGSAVNRTIEQAGNMATAAGQQAQAAVMTGAEALMQMIGNVHNITGTKAGAEAMDAIMARLKTTMAAAPADRAALSVAVEEARQRDPDLKTVIGPVETKDLGAAAMMLALGEMRQKLTNQQSIEDDLLIMQKFAGDDPEMLQSLARLAPYARSGVLSRQRLQQELKEVSGDILLAKMHGEDVSVKERVMARLSALIKIRKDGAPVEGNQSEAVVARARVLLDKGDVRGAMTELQTLQGAEAEAAAPWMRQAAGTVTLDESSVSIAQSLLGQLGGLPAQTPQGAMIPGTTQGAAPASIEDIAGSLLGDIQGNASSIGALIPDFLKQFLGGGAAGGAAPYMSPSMQQRGTGPAGGSSFPVAP